MLGRTWGRQQGMFSPPPWFLPTTPQIRQSRFPSIVSAAWDRPPRIARTAASPSAPRITSKSIYGYIQ
ncbi:hypothetical protein NL108_012218, partial [Boleophthalmus pectinirostris]